MSEPRQRLRLAASSGSQTKAPGSAGGLLLQAGEPFEGIRDDAAPGLYLRWTKNKDSGKPSHKCPSWRFRYMIDGKARFIDIGKFDAVGLAEARKAAKELRAMVTLGHDPAGEKRERKAEALAKIEEEKNRRTVKQLADEYFARMVDGRIKHHDIVRTKIDRDIVPAIGGASVEEVKPGQIDDLLQSIVNRGAPTTANDVLRLLKKIFDFGIKRHYLAANPASAFNSGDAGGKEYRRERSLGLDEVATLFGAMKTANGFARQNDLAVRLLLLLGVRKMELLSAQWQEFNLGAGVWNLPSSRTKTLKDVSIPLPSMAVGMLTELQGLALGSAYLFPSRKEQSRLLPHICENTLNTALNKLEHGLEPFTVHDLRRSMRSQLGALRIPPHIAERCLNHAVKGVEGIYDRYDYFDERKEALETWATVLQGLEDENKVIPIGRKHG